ncbi:MAG: winged helix-turn-helix domain-containing protein [Ktedonobacterales bacterium]|nr:winged helix-turn-helix domain-containing protein [Ktedonobacterales bacterium]
MELSRQGARDLLLAAQGLTVPPRRAARKADVLATIRAMGVLQIDTINVVARSPYLVLWSRLGDFPLPWLEALLSEHVLFEFWSHEACFLPIEDYPLYRRLMLDRRKGWRTSHEWLAEHADVVAQVQAVVAAQGMARSADFARVATEQSGWWNWKIEKQALEHLFNVGDLMVAGRHNFHRLYATRATVLPDWDDADAPSYDEVRRQFALRTVRALGIALARWVPDYYRTPKPGSAAYLHELAVAGELVEARISGWDEPAYLHPDHLALAEAAQAGKLHSRVTTLLSPFDPIIWDRTRARDLFDFDYTIECYTPQPKRQYGYFSLGILHRGALVGRLDPKAHRQAGIMEVKALHFEPAVRLTDRLLRELAETLQRFAHWHATPTVTIRWANVAGAAERLTEYLATGAP